MKSRACVMLCLLQMTQIFTALGNLCTKKVADVVFLLDASFSVYEEDFAMQLKFVNGVIDKFDISDESIRVGVLTYSAELKLNFNLNTYKNKTELKDAINSIEYLGTAGTDTGSALKYARETMLKEKHGGRKSAAKIFIVISDGLSSLPKETARQSKLAKSSGIKIITVGVGRAPTEEAREELVTIASSPAADYLFNVTDFSSLHHIVDSLSTTTCLVPDMIQQDQRTSMTTTNPDVNSKIKKFCGGKPTDVYFIIDTSSSIWPVNFRSVLHFVANVVDLFDISGDITRVGIVLYSDKVSPVVSLNNRMSKSKLKKTILSLHQMKGSTATGDAIRYIREHGFTNDKSRKNASKVAILLTDGQSTDDKVTAEEARKTREAGVTMFAIGIGKSTNKQELLSIATSPQFQYNVADFKALTQIRNTLAIKTCKVFKVPFQVQDSTYVTDDGTCWHSPKDVMFVFDSPSVGLHKTKIIRKAITEMFKSMQVDSNKTKAGILSHYCPLDMDVTLSAFQSGSHFITSAKQQPKDGLKRLLRILRSQSFQPASGGRKQANNVAVIFVDRAEHDAGDVIREAKLLSHKIQTFVIAIGRRTPTRTVEALCSYFTHRCVFHVPEYNSLTKLVPDIMDMVCMS